MKPYYEHAGMTIYHGDCRTVMESLKLDDPHVLVTDPPYGIDLGVPGGSRGRGKGHGLSFKPYASFVDSYDNFVASVVPALNTALRLCVRGAVFTGPHIHEQPKPDAIGGVHCPAGQGRHCWGFKTFLPVLFYGTAPDLNLGSKPTVITSSEVPERAGNDHPVPKPIGWMKWLVGLATKSSEVVFDPFMGSGTTLRAAKDLGRRAIGIEIEERYCEIAAKRLSQEVLPLGAA